MNLQKFSVRATTTFILSGNMSDNSQIIVISEGKDTFATAMKLAFGRYSATHYAIQHPPFFDKDTIIYTGKDAYIRRGMNPQPTELFETQHSRLIFFWHNPDWKTAQELPFKMDIDDAINFAWGWLSKQDYGEEPDHDGSSGKGFAVYNETWGHVGGSFYGICAVSPQWSWYGK